MFDIPGVSEAKLVKVRISDEAKKIIEETAHELDMKEAGVFSRIVAHFARQDHDTRMEILGFAGRGQKVGDSGKGKGK